MTRREAAKIGNKLIKDSKVSLTDKEKLAYFNNIYYWGNRKEQDESRANRSSQLVNKELEQYYKEASKEIQNQIKAVYQDYLQQDVSLDNMNKYLTSDELNNFRISLKSYYNKVDQLGLTNYKDYLKKLSKQATISRLDMLKTNIDAEIKVLQGKERELITRELNRVAEISLEKDNQEVKERIGTALSFEKPADEIARQVVKTSFQGHNYVYRLGVNNYNLASTIKTILPQAFIIGKSSSTLAKELDYRTNVGLHNAQRIVRTEMNRCFNQASMESYKQLGVTEKYQYIASEDERTCDICGEFHEKIFNVKDAQQGLNYPSMHPNCRCTTIPYFEPDEFDVNLAPMKPNELRKWAQELSPEEKKEYGINRVFEEYNTNKKDTNELEDKLKEYQEKIKEQSKIYQEAFDSRDFEKVRDAMNQLFNTQGDIYNTFKGKDITKYLDFKEVKNIDDVVTNMKTLLGGYMNIESTVKIPDKLDVEFANNIFNTVKSYISQYPEMYRRLGSFVIGDLPDGILGEQNSSRVHFNRTNFTSLKELQETTLNAKERNWLSTSKWYGCINHELSHELQESINETRYTSSSGKEGRAGDLLLKQVYKEFNLNEDYTNKVKDGLSIYGSTSESEFFAEAMAEAMSSDSPRDIARRTKELVDEFYEDKDKFIKKYK